MCRMNAGSTLTQELGTRNYISSENTKISMRVKADSEANIRIRVLRRPKFTIFYIWIKLSSQ